MNAATQDPVGAKTAAEKMRVRAGIRAYHHRVPAPVLSRLGLPPLELDQTLDGHFEHIHAFVTTQQQMGSDLPALRDALSARGSLWLSWPKAGQLDTDLSLAEVVRIAYDANLVESTCISIDSTWSALRLTHPIEGRTYRNRHGRLPDR